MTKGQTPSFISMTRPRRIQNGGRALSPFGLQQPEKGKKYSSDTGMLLYIINISTKYRKHGQDKMKTRINLSGASTHKMCTGDDSCLHFGLSFIVGPDVTLRLRRRCPMESSAVIGLTPELELSRKHSTLPYTNSEKMISSWLV